MSLSDPQYVVDQIRAFLAETDQTLTPQLGELAKAYATICAQVNDRLRQCVAFLRKGLRAEAIHVADAEPALLDVLLIVDIPERGEWDDLCATYDLPRAPALMIDAAQELNEAYAIVRPIEVLLDRHRRLALERAPLAERIPVMRALAKADPESLFWEEDIRTFEQARLKELRAEAETAARARDHATLTKLLAEISAPDWRTTVPKDVAAIVQRAELACRQESSASTLRRLAANVEAARVGEDLAATVRLLGDLRAAAKSAEMALPADVQTKVAPAEQWVAKQEAARRQRQQLADACGTLATAVQRGAPASELQSLRAAAAALGTIPPDLAASADRAIRAEASAIRRKKVTKFAVAAIVTIAAAGAVAVIVRNSGRSSQADRALARLKHLVDDGTPESLREADKYVAELSAGSPFVVERSDVSHVVDDLKAKEARETDRAAAFAKAMDRAKSSVDDAKGTGATDAAWDDVHATLKSADSLAVGAGEKSQVADLRQRADSAERSYRSGEERRVQAMIDALKEQTEALEKRADQPSTNVGAALAPADLLKRADDAKSAAEKAKLNTFVTDAQSLADRIAAARDRMAKGDKESERLAAVKDGAASSPAELNKALLAFADACPDSPHAKRFRTAAGALTAWNAIDEAARLWAAWGNKLKPADVKDIPKRLADVTEYLKKYGDYPRGDAFRDYQQYLEAWQRTVADDGPWKANNTRSRLTLPSFKGCTVVAGDDGRRYYLPPGRAPSSAGGDYEISYMTSGVYLQTRDERLIKRLTLHQPTKPNPFPQTALAASIDKMADGLSTDWETFGLDVINKVLDAKDVDPVLRIIIAKRALEMAQGVAWAGKEAMASQAKTWDALDAEEVNWMSPDANDAAMSRQIAADLLGRVADLKTARDAIVRRRDEVESKMKLNVVGRGVLLKDKLDWSVMTNAAPRAGRKVYAVTAKLAWVEVGAARDGRFILDSGALNPETQTLDGGMAFLIDP